VSERPITTPIVESETKPFWDAAATRQFVLKRCCDCGSTHYYPRRICPFCFSNDTEWFKAAGTGTIYSYSVMRRVPVPYAIAYVALPEGVTILTNIVDCDLDAIRVGQPVKVAFKASEEGPLLPVFCPDDG
jgi:uncharacterized protein